MRAWDQVFALAKVIVTPAAVGRQKTERVSVYVCMCVWVALSAHEGEGGR